MPSWHGMLGTAGSSPLPSAGHRDFDRSTGQWLQPDPLGVDGDISLYRYAEGDPVNRSDPSGLCAESQWWLLRIGEARSAADRNWLSANPASLSVGSTSALSGMPGRPMASKLGFDPFGGVGPSCTLCDGSGAAGPPEVADEFDERDFHDLHVTGFVRHRVNSVGEMIRRLSSVDPDDPDVDFSGLDDDWGPQDLSGRRGRLAGGPGDGDGRGGDGLLGGLRGLVSGPGADPTQSQSLYDHANRSDGRWRDEQRDLARQASANAMDDAGSAFQEGRYAAALGNFALATVLGSSGELYDLGNAPGLGAAVLVNDGLNLDPVESAKVAAGAVEDGLIVGELLGLTGAARGAAAGKAGARGAERLVSSSDELVGQGAKHLDELADAGEQADELLKESLKDIGEVGEGGKSPGVGDVPRGANHPKVRASAKTGQEAHRQLQVEGIADWIPEQRILLPSGKVVRKDGVGVAAPNRVRIIKPDTPSGRRSAQKRSDLMREHGYDPTVDLYYPTDPRFQPGSPTYIGPQKK